MKITLTATINIDSSKTDDEIFNSVMKSLSDQGILDLKDKLEKIAKELDENSFIHVTTNSTTDPIDSTSSKPDLGPTPEKKRKYVRRKPIVKPIPGNDQIIHEPVGKNTVILKNTESICHNNKCKKPFRITKFRQKYCSIKCEAEAQPIHIQ